MVHRTYIGLGPPERAVRDFQDLTPHARSMIGLRAECAFGTADHAAMSVAIDGLQTAAYHFTRRRHFYEHFVADIEAETRPGNSRLADRAEALREFEALKPYQKALRDLQTRCRPYGHEYLALDIARQGLLTAACHFTGRTDLYAAGPCGPFRGALPGTD